MKKDNFKVESIAPILHVKNLHHSLAFYTGILGFKNADWGDSIFTYIFKDDAGIYLSENGQGIEGTWIWIGFDGDIFQLHEELKSAGVKIKLPPTNFTWAYELQIEDPNGHTIRIGTERNEEGPFFDDSFSSLSL
jgi:predicted enzyme related to lactoylglutathione lyase